MPHRHRVADILFIILEAILITAAILFLGSFFGVNVREAGGHGTFASTCVSGGQST